MEDQAKHNEEIMKMISTISSDKAKKNNDYEGFEIISDSLDNKLTKDQLVTAVNTMWDIVMVADKDTRDSQYLFPKGVIEFTEGFRKKREEEENFVMTSEQQAKLKTKAQNIKPLVEFLIKMREVIQ